MTGVWLTYQGIRWSRARNHIQEQTTHPLSPRMIIFNKALRLDAMGLGNIPLCWTVEREHTRCECVCENFKAKALYHGLEPPKSAVSGWGPKKLAAACASVARIDFSAQFSSESTAPAPAPAVEVFPSTSPCLSQYLGRPIQPLHRRLKALCNVSPNRYSAAWWQ